jgi:hypothetical protein
VSAATHANPASFRSGCPAARLIVDPGLGQGRGLTRALAAVGNHVRSIAFARRGTEHARGVSAGLVGEVLKHTKHPPAEC